MKIIERNLQEIGKSLFVSLPKEWTNVLKLRKKSKVKMMISEQGTLSIAPEFTKPEALKESEILYDNKFKRRFFKEYFSGSEKIIILFKQKKDEKLKKEVYSFLKNFMNVQIIQESEDRIILKSFKIEDLSIQECLNRMYFLSISMLEETNQDKNYSIQEMRDTMTRFYYMLVMQIRRFLEEGKFAEENQISLIKAMDFRMAAEKIQRVGEISSKIEKINEKELLEFLEIVKKYYSDSILCFINSNYEKALSLWPEEANLKEKYQKIYKKSREKESLNEILQILRYAKEITMLVR